MQFSKIFTSFGLIAFALSCGMARSTGADAPAPPHITVLKQDNGEYLTTFRWNPGRAVTRPSVAGSFNNWNRDAHPMEGPANNGEYRVTLRLQPGRYLYKFVEGANGWHSDPRNPEGEDDGYGGQNSVLRLGPAPNRPDTIDAKRGDGLMRPSEFHHDPNDHRYLDAPQTAGDWVVVRFRAAREDVTAVELIIDPDGKRQPRPMSRVSADDRHEYFAVSVARADMTGKQYTFSVRDGHALETHAVTYTFALDRDFVTPDWAKHAMWYQIMVDRFRDGDPSNNPERTAESSTGRVKVTHPWTADWYKELPYEREGTHPDGSARTFWKWSMYERLFGGDFQGVIDKLDYLKDLGVNAIYLNPVFEASNSHKYNARSYVFADDGYGAPGEFDKSIAQVDLLDPETWHFNKSDQKLLELIREVHERDMKIVLDGVFNHLGDDAVPFQDVKENKQESPFAEWYDIVSWEPFEYRGWAGFEQLPQFRKTADGVVPSLKQHVFDVTRRWMDPNSDGDPSDGIDGWRLDVPDMLPRQFWVEWRDHVKSINPDAVIIGEIWNPADEWLRGDTFDSVMNYQFAKAAFRFFGNKNEKISATEFDRLLGELRMRYPIEATYALQNLYDSHDTDRWVSRLKNPDMVYDDNNRKQDSGPNYDDTRPEPIHYQRQRAMAVFQIGYPGAPMIYYGTEVGMYGADDPMCRLPMWWDDLGPFENPDYRPDPKQREFFEDLFKIRERHPALRIGAYRTLLASDEQDAFVYARWLPGDKEAGVVLIAVNNSDKPQTLEVNISADIANLFLLSETPSRTLVHGNAQIGGDARTISIRLPAISGAILEVK